MEMSKLLGLVVIVLVFCFGVWVIVCVVTDNIERVWSRRAGNPAPIGSKMRTIQRILMAIVGFALCFVGIGVVLEALKMW